MSYNFFNEDCREPERDDSEFGLCDDGLRAYSDFTDPSKWIATVRNERHEICIFTAIDNCVIPRDSSKGMGRCDGMLTTSRHLYLVELKEERTSGITGAIKQLEDTIQLLLNAHNINHYRFKKAFVCNKKHPRFKEIDQEKNLRFFRSYGFRLDVNAEIILI